MGSFLICFLANSACAATPAPASFPCVCWRGGGGELLSWLHGGSAPPCLCACVPALLFIYYLEKGGAGVGGGISEEDVQRAYGMTPTHPPARPHRNRGSGGEPLTAPPVRGAPNAARPPEPPGPWLCAFPAVRGAHTHTHIHADSPNVQRPALSEARPPPPPPPFGAPGAPGEGGPGWRSGGPSYAARRGRSRGSPAPSCAPAHTCL